MKNRGTVADSVGGFGRAGIVRTFCNLYRFPRQKTFHYATHGVEGGGHLAREFCRRGDFFFNLWCEAGQDPAFRFTEDMLMAYPENLEFVTWQMDLPVESDSFGKAMEIRAIVPHVG